MKKYTKFRMQDYERFENDQSPECLQNDYHKRVKDALGQYGIKKYKRVALIDSVDEFIEFLKTYGRDDEYYFRGISNEKQKYCKITRVIQSSTKSNSKKLYLYDNNIQYELELIRKFADKVTYLLKDYNSAVDFVAAAQHYTVNTRYIDWSTSPIVATLFSLREKKISNKCYAILVAKKSENATIYTLPYKSTGVNDNVYITYGQMLHELNAVYNSKNNCDKKDYIRRVFESTHTMVAPNIMNINNASDYYQRVEENFCKNSILFLETNFANSRIASQRGLFQIPPTLDPDYIDCTFEYIDVIFISRTARNGIVKFCNFLGWNYDALMPDCENIAQNVNDSVVIRKKQ